MTTEKLKEIWTEELVKVPDDQLDRFPFKSLTREFLSSGMILESGELSFDHLKDPLETVNTEWKLEDDYFNDYVSIGFNSSGDPIAVDLKNNDQIVYFNHDNDFEEVFINQNIERLIETLIRVEQFHGSLRKYDVSSYYFTEFDDEDMIKLKSDLSFIDSKIFESDSFWNTTLEMYLWDREEERKKADKSDISNTR